MVGHLEVEEKYDVDVNAELPALDPFEDVAVVVRRPTLNLHAVYFDTFDRRLAKEGIALRRRTGGVDDGWHVKVAMERGKLEFHAPLDVGLSPPWLIVEGLETITSGSVLEPIASIKTVRRPFAVVANDGHPLAEIVDDHVTGLRLDGSGREVRWREWEAELIDPESDFLDRVAPLLLGAGGIRSTRVSKLSSVVGNVRPVPRTSAEREQLAQYLAKHLDGSAGRPD